MSSPQADFDRLQREAVQSVREHWGLYLFEGIVLVVLGFLAILIPPLASLAVTFFIGWLFLISGTVGLFTTFWIGRGPGFWWSLASAVLAIVVGILLVGWPVSGVLSLTLLLVVFFVIEGVASIMFALEHRNQLTGRWGWMLASGIIDLVLAAIILAGLPGTAAWAIGILVGINLLMGGTAMIMIALHARATAPQVQGQMSHRGA